MLAIVTMVARSRGTTPAIFLPPLQVCSGQLFQAFMKDMIFVPLRVSSYSSPMYT